MKALAYHGFHDVRVDEVPQPDLHHPKGLRICGGQTPVQKYWKPLLEHIQHGRLKPEAIITPELSLSEGPRGYELSDQKQDGCIKVVLSP